MNNDIKNTFLKVMFGDKSSAGNGFKYKVGEINVANNWNPNELEAKKMGGFNFSTEDKILRWLVRGDTIYNVIIPNDAQIIDCPNEVAPHGLFRSNKIIISNPRKITDEMAMELYKKSNLPEKSYFKAMCGVARRGHMNTAMQIFNDKINKKNIDIALKEFEDFCKPSDSDSWIDNGNDLGENIKKIHEMLLKIKNT